MYVIGHILAWVTPPVWLNIHTDFLAPCSANESGYYRSDVKIKSINETAKELNMVQYVWYWCEWYHCLPFYHQSPVQLGWQSHEKVSVPSEHTPPFSHGSLRQLSMSISTAQSLPPHPLSHVHSIPPSALCTHSPLSPHLSTLHVSKSVVRQIYAKCDILYCWWSVGYLNLDAIFCHQTEFQMTKVSEAFTFDRK